jgi:lauroyl/myristoyl acyltransferase
MRWIDAKDLYYLTVIALIRLTAWSRSSRLSDALANTIARIAWLVPTAKRRGLITKIAACVDQSTPKQLREIGQGTYRAFWQDVFALAATMRPADAQRMRVHGLERLQRALAEGHGAILLEPSFFGRRHLAKIVLHAHGMAIVQVHASDHLVGFWSRRDTRVRRAAIHPFLDACERRFVQDILSLSRDDPSFAFTRRLVSVLQDNRVLCLSGEGRIGRKTVLLPFLGGQRQFVTGVMSLAKHSGAPLLPMFCWRDDDGQVTLAIEQPIEVEGSGAAEAAAAAYSRLLERYVRRYPSEYYGWHVPSDEVALG